MVEVDKIEFYQKAFSRNLGLISPEEQKRLEASMEIYIGNKNPIQKFKRWWLMRKISSLGIELEE